MRRRHSIALSALVSAVLLVVAFARADWSKIVQLLSQSDGKWAALALAALTCAFLIHCLRWAALLASLGLGRPFRTLLGIHYAGLLANQALPAQFGLDAVRVMIGGRLIGSRTTMAGVVFADRIAGAWSVAAVAATGSVLLTPAERPDWALPVALALLSAASLVALLAVHFSGYQVLRRLPLIGERAFWSRALEKLEAVRSHFAGRKSHLALVMALASLQILMLGLSVGLAARALALPLTLRSSALAFPIIALLIMIAPVTIGGHGLREALFPLVLGPLGLSGSEALALALAWFGLMVLASLPGAVALLSFRRGSDGFPGAEPP